MGVLECVDPIENWEYESEKNSPKHDQKWENHGQKCVFETIFLHLSVIYAEIRESLYIVNQSVIFVQMSVRLYVSVHSHFYCQARQPKS